MYDPSVGRWLQQDPIRFDAGDYNLERYVRNDATNETDPSGLAEDLTPDQIREIRGREMTVLEKTFNNPWNAAEINRNVPVFRLPPSRPSARGEEQLGQTRMIETTRAYTESLGIIQKLTLEDGKEEWRIVKRSDWESQRNKEIELEAQVKTNEGGDTFSAAIAMQQREDQKKAKEEQQRQAELQAKWKQEDERNQVYWYERERRQSLVLSGTLLPWHESCSNISVRG